MRKIIILLLILVNIVYVGKGVANFGAQSIDVYANWLFKAKVLYLHQGFIPDEILENGEYKSAHWHYPILWPMLVWQIYRVWGMDESFVLGLYPVFYAVVLLLAAVNLRKNRLSWLKVLLWVYVYSMLGPLLSQGGRFHAGNADILVVILGWLIVGFRDKKWLVSVLVMVASMIKTEGVFWAVFLLNSRWILVAILPTFGWQLFLKANNVPSDFGLVWPSGIGSRLEGLFRGVIGELLKLQHWYILWPIFFLSAKRSSLWKPLILMFLAFAGVYLGTNIETYGYVSSSFDRVLLQLSPIWLTMLASWV